MKSWEKQKFAPASVLFRSWLKKTSHITDDCKFCNNVRYLPYGVLDSEYDQKVHACPVCNFGDMARFSHKNVWASQQPQLHLFPLIKRREIPFSILD